MAWWIVLGIILPILWLVHRYVQHKFSYWSSRGITGPPPSLLKLGTIFDRVCFSPSQYEVTYLRKYGKVYGLYRLFHPTLTVIDAELLKQILIKDFHLFVDRARLNTYDELWNENVFNAPAASWKRIRTITSPTFTSGKLRQMSSLMNRCIDKLVAYFDRLATTADGVFSAKELIASFTIDVIASTSFACETQLLESSPFVANGIALFRMNPLKILCFLLLPRWLNDLLSVRLQFPDGPFRFFEKLAREIVGQRKSGQVVRNDFAQLLMDACVEEGELQNADYDKLTADIEKDETFQNSATKPTEQSKAKNTLTESEIIAQSVFFLIAGFETTASTLTHLVFELVQNPDVQERLADELRGTLAGLSVESEQYLDTVMNRLPYLDAVVKETLRKYPPLTRVERRCSVAGYRLGGLTLEKDQHIEVPLYAVHHCPDYWPEPERFNPERFLPENKNSLVPFTFMPFGQGPRNCLGLRFAYQEIKLCIARVVTHFRFSATVDTPAVLQYQKSTLLLNTVPFKLRVSKRF